MNGVEELAKLLKERDNNEHMGMVTATVIDAMPNIKLSLGDRIILTASHLIIANLVTTVDYLSSGDTVILMPNRTEQKYFLIDKVVV
jgi:hypothetical protein